MGGRDRISDVTVDYTDLYPKKEHKSFRKVGFWSKINTQHILLVIEALIVLVVAYRVVIWDPYG